MLGAPTYSRTRSHHPRMIARFNPQAPINLNNSIMYIIHMKQSSLDYLKTR